MDLGRLSVPLAAGLAAAAAAFAVVALTTDGDPAPASNGPAPVAAGPGAVALGAEVFARMGCGNCHTLAAAHSQGQIGPDLDGVLPAHTRRSLAAVILSPPAGSPMPRDFGGRMDDAEFQALVTFLLTARDVP